MRGGTRVGACACMRLRAARGDARARAAQNLGARATWRDNQHRVALLARAARRVAYALARLLARLSIDRHARADIGVVVTRATAISISSGMAYAHNNVQNNHRDAHHDIIIQWRDVSFSYVHRHRGMAWTAWRGDKARVKRAQQRHRHRHDDARA